MESRLINPHSPGQNRNINSLVMRLKFYAALLDLWDGLWHLGTDGLMVRQVLLWRSRATTSYISMNGLSPSDHNTTTSLSPSLSYHHRYRACTLHKLSRKYFSRGAQYNSSRFLEQNFDAHNNHLELYRLIESFWHFIGIFRNADLNRFILRIMISVEELSS